MHRRAQPITLRIHVHRFFLSVRLQYSRAIVNEKVMFYISNCA